MPPTTTSPPLPHTTTKPHHHNTSSTLKNHTTKILKTPPPQPLQNQTNIPQNTTFHHTLPQIKKHTKINTLKIKNLFLYTFPTLKNHNSHKPHTYLSHKRQSNLNHFHTKPIIIYTLK